MARISRRFEQFTEKYDQQFERKADELIILKVNLFWKMWIPKNYNWKIVDDRNAKICEICYQNEINFANLDPTVLQFNKSHSYNGSRFYCLEDKLHFRVMASSFNADGTLIRLGL